MIIRLRYPLISCVCITDSRPDFLLKSIIYFDSQKYPNKELVISYPEDDLATENLIKKVIDRSGLNIVIIERSKNITLGKARNEAVEKSNGNYICTWDDDDFYFENRLLDQYNNMISVRQKREACILTNVVLYDGIKHTAHLSDYYNWAGTLLCKKSLVLQHPYADTNTAEDGNLIKYLTSSKYLHTIPDQAHLYVYNYHGKNTLNKYYFNYFQRKGGLLKQESLDYFSSSINMKVSLESS